MSNFISMDDLTQLRLCNGYYCFCFYLFWVFFQYYKHKKATTIACEENKFCDHRLIGLSLKLPRANCVPKLFIAVRSLQLRLTWTKKKRTYACTFTCRLLQIGEENTSEREKIREKIIRNKKKKVKPTPIASTADRSNDRQTKIEKEEGSESGKICNKHTIHVQHLICLKVQNV